MKQQAGQQPGQQLGQCSQAGQHYNTPWHPRVMMEPL